MKKWFNDMEKITIGMGVAIIMLGLYNMVGVSTIPAALVTGISISGFCLTLVDFLSKLNEDYNLKTIKFLAKKSGVYLYLFATVSIICFPYMNIITSLSKDTLDKMSTITSVIALGLVFVSIGYNNRREVIKDVIERNDRYENLLTKFENATFKTGAQVKQMSEQTKQLSQQTEGLSQQTEGLSQRTVGLITLIEKKDERIKELEEKLHDLETKNSTPSV
ncbi:hypothetical protein QUG28_26095 [Bacillus hominis]|uniref:hypothetical protein n=1 Tax=Bacillus hominis TaxID=2817478 RepID=UPI0025A0679A|nr:hypothetical protein [Bacillus hominis]MDM5436151.1 hypothetical protein [Bacillus hominis]